MKKEFVGSCCAGAFAGVLAGCISGHGTQEAKLNIIDDNYRNYYEILSAPFMTVMGTAWGI